jgi:CRISPR-associated protein (TIGR02584 family)
MHSHSAPQDHPRRVLLAVAGLSPQIVTESYYGLAEPDAASGRAPFVPTEVRLVTSAKGAERAELSLLSRGWFQRLLDDYGLPTVAFGTEHIDVVADAEGNPLVDIRTAVDNERIADHLTDTVRELTADPDCALHVSIAGGRKTMGYYAGYALSLFGRPQDRLSHVLVSEPFESSWDFFYPTPYSRVITLRDNELADTRHARVTLAEIPFVRLPEPLLSGRAGFVQTIAAAQRAQQAPELVVDLKGRRIEAAGQLIAMQPAHLAFYAVFARRLLRGLGPARHDTEGFTAQYLDELRRVHGEHAGNVARAEEKTYAQGMDDGQFQMLKSRANGRIRETLGAQAAAPYLIDDDGGDRPFTRYQLSLAVGGVAFGAAEAGPADGPFTTGNGAE